MGRGAGMIDIYSFTEMIDAMTLMENSKAFTPKVKERDERMVHATSGMDADQSVAAEEQRAKNNHGLAYDVQLTAYALYTGNQDLAMKTIQEFPKKRLFAQIEPDGKQPFGTCTTPWDIRSSIWDTCSICVQSPLTLGQDIYNATTKWDGLPSRQH